MGSNTCQSTAIYRRWSSVHRQRHSRFLCIPATPQHVGFLVVASLWRLRDGSAEPSRESLRKHDLRKPDCKTLLKVYLLLAPPRLWARGRTCLLSLAILNVFTLFVITSLKPIVSANYLSFVCPKRFTIKVCQVANQHIKKYSYTVVSRA